MSSNNQTQGKKRSKAFYRKSAYGAKRQCTGRNVLEPGIRGFLVMCHSNESSAVRESYNILNEYADLLYGPEKTTADQQAVSEGTDDLSKSDDDCEDMEKALKKEVDGLKSIAPKEKRFQNVATKAKNLVFIRTTLEDTVQVVTTVMEDIASRKLKRARYAARMLPIVGTCKAQTAAIAELAKTTLASFFSPENPHVPSCFTVMYKTRNNNGTTCGKESVIPAVKHELLTINPNLKFAWSEYDVAILVEIVCTTCCLGLAPGYDRLRKFNFQELAQGPRLKNTEKDNRQAETVDLKDKELSKSQQPEEGSQIQTQAENDIVPIVDKNHLDKPFANAVEQPENSETQTPNLGAAVSEKVECPQHDNFDETQGKINTFDNPAGNMVLKFDTRGNMNGNETELEKDVVSGVTGLPSSSQGILLDPVGDQLGKTCSQESNTSLEKSEISRCENN